MFCSQLRSGSVVRSTWIRRVVQDENTKIFSAQVWNPLKPYIFRHKNFKPKVSPLLIYECHIGMATNIEKVGTYNEFREEVLPRIAKEGYNAIQIMAIQEHPYYGSFGYHVLRRISISSLSLVQQGFPSKRL